ncbi:MAG: hypothetical protein ISS15_15795 [Alphaproteobacteria bacterium]|nr:hypothetical protein [Alphaproteobacteria bacterium]MBL6938053.1 hypothetical protein [Alphaproteobacteria bacterium]MBL7099122.1 hypothetical protein [Alphaproteobacteria bacterium]
MQIDPVVALTARLTQAERRLREARLKHDNQMTGRLLAAISLLNEELFSTVPTSVLGAAELLRVASNSLGEATGPPYAAHLREISTRLSNGSRELRDLIWLRSVQPALTGGLCGNDGIIAAPLIASALQGAARPVMIFRAVLPLTDDDSRMNAPSHRRW